jgi:Tfp pilus assembly protein PilX
MKVRIKKRNTVMKGSAIITALIVMTVLLLLGLAVATVSMSALKTNASDADNNDAYYAAESAVTSAIGQLKYEVSSYYMSMLTAQSPDVLALYNNFFAAINSNTTLHFAEPVFKGITTDTTFSLGTFDSVNNTCEFLISSVATVSGGARYRVDGTLLVKRLDVEDSQYNWITDNAAIKAGGSLNLMTKNSVTVDNGNIIVAQMLYDANNSLPYTITGGQLIIDPNVGLTIRDVLTYPSFETPVVTSPATYVTSSGTSYNWANIPAEPLSILTAPNVSLHFSNCTMPAGVIYCKGDISISNCVVNCDIYCDGNVSISNYSSLGGTVYCRGNISVTNASVSGNMYCDGSVGFNNGTLSASIYAEDGISMSGASSSGNLYSPLQISIANSTVTDGIIYSSTKLLLGGTSQTNMTAALFSGGDIEFTGDTNVAGTMIAKKDIYFKVDANKDLYVNYYYSDETIMNLVSDPNNAFFFTVPGTIRLDEDVFLGQSITAVGRQ